MAEDMVLSRGLGWTWNFSTMREMSQASFALSFSEWALAEKAGTRQKHIIRLRAIRMM
jgi:hypothetical protein